MNGWGCDFMEFKSINIKNFLSYYDENEIEFSPMTTIIVGQNNTGKSKLFDAINFVLCKRVYDTEKESWQYDDDEIAGLILNRHKINVALQNQEERVDATVCLTIDSGDMWLKIERSFRYQLRDGKYVFANGCISFSEIDKFNGKPTPCMGADAEERLKIYFQESIWDFFLFQGESASKIMQLHKGGNFRRAVKEIARLGVFEMAKDYAEKYDNTIRRSITMKSNKNIKKKSKCEDLQNEMDKLLEQKSDYEKKRYEAERCVEEYSRILEKANEELEKLKESENYFKQKKKLEDDRKDVERGLKSIDSEKELIAEDSVFYKVREKIQSFSEFYSRLEKEGDVPPSIPQHEIRKALECYRCTICNTDLSKGSEARKFAESRISSCDTDKLGDYLRELNYTLGSVSEDIQKVPENLERLLSRKRSLDEKKSNLIKEKEQLSEILESIQVNSDFSEDKKNQIDKAKQTVARYNELLERAKTDKANADGSINHISDEMSEKKKQLDQLITDDDEIDEEDKIRSWCAAKLSSAMKRCYELASETAYSQVEAKANEYYKEMTHENAALVGELKIDLATSEIYTVDEDGVRIYNINQGNRISIQLAVIAAILTVAQEQFGIQYPFVTDAPVSHLGGDNKRTTIETMVNAFEQSVLIIKDDSSTKDKSGDEIRKLIADSDEIEIAYELSLSQADNIGDQYTVVKKIKG